MKYLPKNNAGQALLLVLLSLAVVLTIVLSILSRSVTDIAVTSREEESQRAFSAAEAGVEKALILGTPIGLTPLGDASFKADVSGVSEGAQEYSNPQALSSGESATVWFVAHDTNGDLICSAPNPCFTGSRVKVCWGKPGTSATSVTTPAIEVSVFYAVTPGDYSSLRIARDTYDPNSTRTPQNKFSPPDAGTCTVSGDNYQFQKTIDLGPVGLGIGAGSYGVQNGLQFARIRFLYNTDQGYQVGLAVNFAGNSVLPSQGLKIDASGISGEANRKLSVFQGYPEPPSIFDSAVFSLGGITK